MSKLAQTTLMQHLTEVDSLEVLAREGLLPDVIPAPELRQVMLYALDYFHRGGRTKAPSIAALRAEEGFANALDDNDVDLEEEPSDTIEWAIDTLKATYVHKVTQKFNKDFATGMSEAQGYDRLQVLSSATSDLAKLSMSLERKDSVVDVREGIVERMQAYEARVLDPNDIIGIRTGWRLVDEHSRGIHPGELAVLAAGPKTGKSYYLAWVAYQEWLAGRVCVLYTLENSVQMTIDRIACLATGIDSEAWQDGRCDPREVERVLDFQRQLAASETPLYIVQPQVGDRTPHSMIRKALLRECDSVLIDQLTFVEHDEKIRERYLQIRQMLHDIKTLISTGRDRVPCMVAHQISRDGVKAAEKVGHLEMYHMAEGSEVERTADWAYGLYRDRAQVAANFATLQTLACRRRALMNFEMGWNLGSGALTAIREIEITDRGEA